MDVRQQLDEETCNTRFRTKELLFLWACGPVWWHVEAFWFPNMEDLQTPSFWGSNGSFITQA